MNMYKRASLCLYRRFRLSMLISDNNDGDSSYTETVYITAFASTCTRKFPLISYSILNCELTLIARSTSIGSEMHRFFARGFSLRIFPPSIIITKDFLARLSYVSSIKEARIIILLCTVIIFATSRVLDVWVRNTDILGNYRYCLCFFKLETWLYWNILGVVVLIAQLTNVICMTSAMGFAWHKTTVTEKDLIGNIEQLL